MRADHNADVKVVDCQGPERVIAIGPDYDTYCNVLRDMMKHLDSGRDDYEMRVLLHQSLAGAIIGKGGSKIKEIKDKIGCKLKIFPNTAPQSSDRVAQIIGTENQCMECLAEIVDLMNETKIKGPINNYDPYNFDDMYADVSILLSVHVIQVELTLISIPKILGIWRLGAGWSTKQ